MKPFGIDDKKFAELKRRLEKECERSGFITVSDVQYFYNQMKEEAGYSI